MIEPAKKMLPKMRRMFCSWTPATDQLCQVANRISGTTAIDSSSTVHGRRGGSPALKRNTTKAHTATTRTSRPRCQASPALAPSSSSAA
ncbi:hypothetical protein [Nannocystis pusilla]|uniref:hypothetical protein n=1 Tax=Nannocystis pusilla TaxID=889268 RepID=UPI003B81C13E